MKYEARVDLRNPNTSHALLIDLVGRDKRVLDVGCASGYLGETLKQRGCTVAGVEFDGEAAAEAKGVLDEVVVGDVGELDLVDHFGLASFDVVIFGDVLEHVVDPVAVLRRVRPLLDESGSVVVSIPNVAHGSVRLSLMSGRFEYRPLGLLDETHLRFFTRDSLYGMFRDAGYIPVDVRRTTAGIFETEVAVRREDFDDDVVHAVETDPDATTYQFVVKAVPEDSRSAADAPSTPAVGPAPRCRIGVWSVGRPDDLRNALVMRVTRAEMAARLPDATIRLFTPGGYLEPTPHSGGEPVEPFGDLSPDRIRELANQLDCVVLTGDLADDEGGAQGDPAPFLLEGLGLGGDIDCPVLWSAVRLPAKQSSSAVLSSAGRPYATVLEVSGAHPPPEDADAGAIAVPDPLVLTARHLRPDVLNRRLEFLRVMGWFPQDGPAIVVEVRGEMLPHAPAIGSALDTVITNRRGASVVLLELEPDSAVATQAVDALIAALPFAPFRMPPDAIVDDIVAAVANSAVLVASSPFGVSLALAYGLPHAVVDLAADSGLTQLARSTGNLDGLVTRPGELSGLLEEPRFRSLPGATSDLQARLDRHFDRVAAIADGAAAARPRVAEIGPVLPAPEYIAALEIAHARMQQRVDAERKALADHLVDLRGRHDAELLRVGEELEEAKRSLSEAATDAVTDERARAGELQAALAEMTRRLAEQEKEYRRLRAIEDHLTAELEALKNTRVLRLVRPVRALYARLRGSRL